ncbi:hypothetical protein A2955_04985 [Candidatus Woesebacteria bacterium RIFCSPLOWO2_01_FULL_37_19]|uniref:Uncharacterized protein n=1 Tax=Candidatus Woesebacteria bacterium RIFCSPLOWO2_01_FULL_37_19 TaxID=1802514 RepID=A0A1F8B0B2_9BACT|nr:MAG: hypothetical protein A2955_04985 [Candidatus Woesebacteria bacterium RIFCSPLOWO2_01_FULL_37_19]
MIKYCPKPINKLMYRLFSISLLILFFLFTKNVQAQSVEAEGIVNIVSGTGDIGGRDNNIRYIQVQQFDDPVGYLTSNDFNNAKNGEASYIVEPHPYWIKNLASDARAEWVSTIPDVESDMSTTLFAFKFNSPIDASSIRMDIAFAIDNVVPYEANYGIYLNEVSMKCAAEIRGSYLSENFDICRADVKITKGENILYIIDGNDYGPIGIILSADLYLNPQESLFGIGGGEVLAASTEFVPTPTETPVPTATIIPTATPMPDLTATPPATSSATKGGVTSLPEAGGFNLNLVLTFFSVGIWGYYFYLKYRII